MIQLRKSLPFRIFLTFIILLCLPLFVDAFILVNQSAEEAVANAQSILLENSSLREFPLNEILPTHTPITALLTNELGLTTHFPQKNSQELDQKLTTLAREGNYSAVILLAYDAKDDTFYKVGSSQGKNFFSTDITSNFKSLNPGKKEFSVIWVEGASEFHFLNASFVYSEAQDLLGAILVYRPISEKLNALLQPSMGEAPIFFGILLPSMIIFNATDSDLVMNYLTELGPATKRQMQERIRLIKEQNLEINDLAQKPLDVTWQKESHFGDYRLFEFQWKGETQIANITEIGKTGFYLLTYVSKQEILQDVFAEYMNIYRIYSTILLIGGLLSFLLIMRFARPLNKFIDVMNQVGQGKEEVRYVPDRLGFEVNQLGTTFNNMLDSLVVEKKMVEEEHIKRELYKKELTLGEKVQRRLFLEEKVVPKNVDIASLYLPAKEVGGDFCDLFMHHDKLVLMIADAAGKGVEACFYSLIVRSLLRILSQEIPDTAQVIYKANSLFLRDVGDTGFFVTVLLAFFDTKTHKLTYYSGGHNPPIVRRKNGSIEILEHHGPALGIDLGPQMHHAREILLEPGDLILFYTDGVTEAHSPDMKLFSEERLISVVQREGTKTANHLAQEILTEIRRFENGGLQHDDITMMVMKVQEEQKVDLSTDLSTDLKTDAKENLHA